MKFGSHTKQFLFGMILIIPLLFLANLAHAKVIDPDPSGTTVLTSCGELAYPGTYLINSVLTNTDNLDPCITITSDDVIIGGDGSVGFNQDISATGLLPGDRGLNFTLQDITFSGDVSSQGNGEAFGGTITFGGDADLSGTAIASSTIFNGNSYNEGDITASSTIFNGSSYNDSNGTVNGDAVLIIMVESIGLKLLPSKMTLGVRLR